MHVQSCFFVNQNMLFYCRSRCRRCRCWLGLLVSKQGMQNIHNTHGDYGMRDAGFLLGLNDGIEEL